MNRVYRVVWNVSAGAWVAVSELAKGHSKTKSKSVQLLALPVIAMLTFSSDAWSASYAAGGGTASATNSVAIGTDASTASKVNGANQSVAIGYASKASGDQTVALGANVIASGNSAVAVGGDDIDRIASDKTINDSYEALTGVRLVGGKEAGGSYRPTTASGAGSVAMGTQSAASGHFSTALGMTSTASGDASSALGVYANASGGAALAIGAISKAEAEQSIALGTNSKVAQSADNSIAIGNGAVATNKDSIAIGSGSSASSTTLSDQAFLVGGTARGEMNIGDRRITGVSAGSADTDAVNVSQLKTVSGKLNQGFNLSSNGADQGNVQMGDTIDIGTAADEKNLKVTKSGNTIDFTLSQDLELNSVQTGNSTLNSNGLSIANGPSVTVSGIDAGNKKITNVAKGDLSATSTDAINGSQLNQAQNNVASMIGGNAALNNAGDVTVSNIGGTGKNTIDEAVAAAKTTVTQGKNVVVTETKNVDGSSNYEVKTADDLNINSVTAGGTVLNSNGLSIANGPSVTVSGIDAGNKKITNVAKGDLSATSTDAINGSQLNQAQNNVASMIGGNAALNNAGDVTVSNIGGTGKNTIDEAVAAAKTTVTQGKNVVVTETKNVDGSSNYEVKTADDLNINSVTTGGTVLNSNGLSITNGPSMTVSGINAGNQKITSVAAGDITATSTDAVNGSQLFALKDKLDTTIINAIDAAQPKISLASDGKDQSIIADQDVIDIGTAAGETNLTATKTGNTIDFALNKDLNVSSVTAGGTMLNKDGLSFQQLAADGVTLVQTGPSVKADGIDAGDTKMTNVANGDISAISKDAVNGSQLFVTDTIAKNALDTANKGFALTAQDGKKVQKALGESVEVVGADKNISTQVSNGQIQIQLADDIEVKSITAGGNTLDQKGLTVGDTAVTSNGMTIVNGPSVLASGIDAGNKKITSVASGNVSSTSKDAVNGSQLYNAQNNVAGVIGGNTKIDPNTGNISTSNIGGTGKNTIDEAVAAAKTTVTQSKNMVVKATENTDGSTNYEVATADDLDVTSLKAGNTTINNNGLSITGGPSVLASGIDAGNKKITGVASGDISATSKDAVNGSQLNKAQNNVASVIGGNAAVNHAGDVTVSNIGGTGKNTINEAIAAAKTTVSQGKNMVVTETKNADGSSNYEVKTSDNLDVTSLKAGNTLINNNGLSITGGPSILASGIDAGNKKITSVANGDVSSVSKDAVNGSQLYAVDSRIDDIINKNIANLEQGFSLSSNGLNTGAVLAGATIDIGTAAGEKNLTVTKTGNTIDFALNPDLDVTSVTAGGTVLNHNGLSFVSDDGKGNLVQTGPVISAGGIDAGAKKITSVANGDVSATSKDAVNGSQLYNAQNNVAGVIGGNTKIDPNTGSISTSNIGGTGKNTIDEAVAAAKTTVTQGKNMVVAETKNADGSSNYEVRTADDLDVNSLKAGNTTINSNGLSIVGGPSLLASGIDAGNKKITSVAKGDVSSTSKDAVNGSQLYNAQNNVAGVIGGNTKIDPNTGSISTSNIGGTGKNTIDEAVAAAKTTVTQGKNMVVTETKNADGSSNYEIKTADDLQVNSVKAGNSILNNQGLSITGGPSVLVSGINAGNKKITSVANGSVNSSSTDAVNGSQLYAIDSRLDDIINKNINALEKGFSLSSNGENTKSVLAGETIDIGTAADEKNLSVSKTGNTIDFALNPELNVDSVNAGGTVINSNGLSFLTLDADGNMISMGPSISFAGINAGNTKVTNVANGDISSTSKDAVNGSQLHQAQDNLAGLIGGNAQLGNNGNVTVSNIGGTGQNTIHDAIESINQTANNANQGWNVSTNGGTASNVKPGNTVDFGNTDGNVSISNDGNNITVNMNKDQNLGADGSVTVGDSKLDNNGLTIDGGPSITKDGIDAAGNKVTNVGDGQIAAGSQDAVNGGQIHDMLGQGAFDANGNISNIGGTGADNINDAIAAVNKNATESKSTVTAGDNIVVSTSKNDDGSTNYQVSTSPNLKVDSVDAERFTAGNTTIDSDGLTIKDGPSITSGGINAGNKVVEGVANGNISSSSQQAVNGSQLNSTNQAMAEYLGGNAGYDNITQSLTAPTYTIGQGTDAKDYHNVGDALGALNAADQQLGDRITNLGDQLQQAFQSTSKRIDDVEKKANAGIAAAMALENAPYVPGKYTYAAGAAYHGGESAIGVTLRKTADNGRWSLTGGIATASQGGDPSVRVGISGVID